MWASVADAGPVIPNELDQCVMFAGCDLMSVGYTRIISTEAPKVR